MKNKCYRHYFNKKNKLERFKILFKIWKPTPYNNVKKCLLKIKEKTRKDLYNMITYLWKHTPYNTVKNTFHKTFINQVQ